MAIQEMDRVLIVGGGVGGMSLAIQLRRQGVAVDIAELDSTWRPIGAGLTLNGATLRALDTLGVLDAVERQGHLHGGRRIHDMGGVVLNETPAYTPERGDISAGGGILRPVLHNILSEQVLRLGVKVMLGRTVARLSQEDDGVSVTFDTGESGRYSLVVGADGLMSRVRQLAFAGAPQPSFTGQGCWRAIFPRPAEIKTVWIFLDEGHKVGLNPISADEMYMFLLESAPGNPWREFSQWPEELRSRLTKFDGPLGRLGHAIDETSRINYRPLETVLLPAPWHQGRVVLLGDACHATTPHAGYGAGLAIEDAVILASCLDGPGDIDARLTHYVERRYERCRQVLQGSVKLGELEMAQAPVMAQMGASMALSAIIQQAI